MSTLIRTAAVSLALATAVGAAHAQTVITTQPVETRTVITRAPLQLTPTQRTTIYRTITRNGTTHERIVTEGAAPPAPGAEIVVGARVPASVALQPLPDEVVTETPVLRPYKYMMVNNRVWLVDPETGTVVGEANQ